MAAFNLVMTCSACPEQYNVFENGKRVGYLRLRHGYFRAECIDDDMETVYTARTIGDGVFDASERDFHINAALEAIRRKLDGNSIT